MLERPLESTHEIEQMTEARACAKIIMFGEHAVVFGRPGIALPVTDLYTLTTLEDSDTLGISTAEKISSIEESRLSKLVHIVLQLLNINRKFKINIESNIPLGSGLGSSASLSISLIRVLSKHLKLNLTLEKINEVAFECEKMFHGTPSGIDNTVITYEKPVFFGDNTEFIKLGCVLKMLIISTSKSNTGEVVSGVRKRYQTQPRYSYIFDEIGRIATDAKSILTTSDLKRLGLLMYKNHELLREIEVSTDELDFIVDRCKKLGAYGAKLAGAGKGGNVIVLLENLNDSKILKEFNKYKLISTTIK